VYEDVAAGFTALCASLLPSLELQLVRTASLAHEGLKIRCVAWLLWHQGCGRLQRKSRCPAPKGLAQQARAACRFRRLQDGSAAEASAAAAAAAELGAMPAGALGEWQHNLGQLSGGQRTLVSLAMLLAVACAGGSSTGLLLLDEVDAALDEHNTARAAALLRQLAHGGCQVLCVTHNAAFQGCCDGFIRVSKPAGGHTVPAGGEAEEGMGASGKPQRQQRQQQQHGRAQQAGSVAAAAAGGGVEDGGGGGGRRGSRAKRVRFAAA
jgi:chromosome segregation ATPase